MENIQFLKTLTPDKLRPLIRELTAQRFTLKDTEIRNRTINYWSQEGLLLGDSRKGAWRRLSYLDILWLRIVSHLRGFEISLELIRKVKEAICNDDIPLWSLYSDHEVPEDEARISSLASLVVQAIGFRRQPVIILTRQGEVKTLYPDSADVTGAFFSRLDLLSKTFLCVSLNEVMLDSFRKIGMAILTSNLEVFTPAEAEVITRLRGSELKSVRVTLDQGREIDLLDVTAPAELSPVDRFLEIVWCQGYERITSSTRDGRVTYFDYPDGCFYRYDR